MSDARVLRELAKEVEQWLADAIESEREDKVMLGDMYDHNDFGAGFSAGHIDMARTTLERIRALASDIEAKEAGSHV